MKLFKIYLLVGLLFFLIIGVYSFNSYKKEDILYIIENPSQKDFNKIINHNKVAWWLGFGKSFLIAGEKSFSHYLKVHKYKYKATELNFKHNELYLVGSKKSSILEIFPQEKILYHEGGVWVVAIPTTLKREIEKNKNLSIYFKELPLNTFVISKGAPSSYTDFPPEIDELVEKVSQETIINYLEGLTQFPTRYTYSPNFQNVTNWVAQTFINLGLEEELDSFYISSSGPYYNVIGRITGATYPEKVYIVGAHYDSTSNDPYNNAKGADDNASGVAGVMEIGRILSEVNLPCTVLFIAFAGEEQGLYGSSSYVDDLTLSGKIKNVKAMFNLDMIGFMNNEIKDVLIESATFASKEMDILVNSAYKYTSLIPYLYYSPWGSDHVPFIEAGISAILSIEYEYSNNYNYHKTTDTLDTLRIDFIEEIVKMNLGGLLETMNFPTGEESDDSGEDTSSSFEETGEETDDGPFDRCGFIKFKN